MALNLRRRKQLSSANNKKIFSYYKGESNIADAQKIHPSSNKRFHNLPYYLSIIVMIFCVGYAMTLTNTPSVKVINQDDDRLAQLNIDPQQYRSIIQEKLKNSPMNLTKLTIDTDKVEDELKSVITEATEIAISLPIVSRTPVVYIRIAEPVATLSAQGKVFLIDEKGRAVKTVEDSVLDYLKITDTSGLLINEGSQALPTKQLQFMQNVDKQLRRQKIIPTEYTYSNNANEVLVKIKGRKYYAKFNLVGDSRLQSGALIAAIRDLDKKNIKPSTYIDVRVEERAYYK